MSDDNITEFKKPNVVINNYEDNPEFYNALLNESLSAWKSVYNNLKERDLLENDIQALSGLISCSIQYMTMVVGRETTLDLLEEHTRRLRVLKEEDLQ